jgi:hypothetical protein
MKRYEIIEAKRWVHVNGATASIYGSCPYMSDNDKPNWSIQTVGWTIRDNKTNTVGMGRKPFDSMYDASMVLHNLNVLSSR